MPDASLDPCDVCVVIDGAVYPTIQGTLRVPRLGVWHADVVIDAVGIVSGPCILRTQNGELVFTGTIVLGGERDATTEVRIVGGAGGLNTILAPSFYQQAPLRNVLSDIARRCGETLSNTLDSTVLNALLPVWVRDGAAAGRAIESAIAAAGLGNAVWRVLGDGTLWVGEDTWPNVEVPGDIQATSPVDGSVELSVDTPFSLLAPGTTWLEQKVTYVEHNWRDSESTTRVWFERLPAFVDTGAPQQREAPDRIKSSFKSLVSRAVRGNVYNTLWQGTVTSQSGALVTVMLDAPTLPPMTDIPLLACSPGLLAQVQPGARVLVGFINASPALPVALLFAHNNAKSALTTIDATAIKIGAGATKKAVRDGDDVNATLELKQWAADVETACSGAGFPVTHFFPNVIGNAVGGSNKTTIE